MKTYNIDAKLPTPKELEEINKSCCIKCGEPYNPSMRVVFVQTDKKILWWHGLIKKSEYPCLWIDAPKKPKKKKRVYIDKPNLCVLCKKVINNYRQNTCEKCKEIKVFGV